MAQKKNQSLGPIRIAWEIDAAILTGENTLGTIWHDKSIEEVAGKIAQAYFLMNPDMRPGLIRVKADGIGLQLYDMLRERWGFNCELIERPHPASLFKPTLENPGYVY